MWAPLASAALCLAVGLTAISTAGCSVSDEDLRRWETTMEGPKRLRAVIMHDKYPHQMRVQAAMSLIRMKPRKGQRIGIKLLVEKTLAKMSPEERSTLLADLVPLMEQELRHEPPKAQPGQPLPPDPSFKYKDAAYMMLTHERASEGTTIIADPALKKALETTLTVWAMVDFERRLNDRAQMYGMEQLLRYIGASSVVGLPALMTKNAKSLTKMADIVAKMGDQKTKEEAAQKLVGVGEYISSEQWRTDKKPELEEANRRAQIEPTPDQFKKQLARYQDESLLRVFGSMKKVGGRAVLDYCLKIAADKKHAPKRRQAALAALEGRIPRDAPELIERVLAIASSDAPDIVLDQVFRRIRELPRDKVIDKLYALFKSEKWQIRRAAGATALQMSTVKHIDEFMTELGRKATKNFTLSEAVAYGAYIGDLKEGKPQEALDRYLRGGSSQARVTALSYYFTYGLKKDIPTLEPLERDKQDIPPCDEEQEDKCGWQCEVAKEGDPKARENKDVETIGEFVRYCVKPQMERNKPKDDKKKEGKGDDKGKEKKGDSP